MPTYIFNTHAQFAVQAENEDAAEQRLIEAQTEGTLDIPNIQLDGLGMISLDHEEEDEDELEEEEEEEAESD